MTPSGTALLPNNADRLLDPYLFDLIMDENTSPGSLLDELDKQQDEVLNNLDSLNAQIEDVLQQWQSSHKEAA